MKTTTEKVKRVVEKFGYHYELVEKFNHYTKRRKDFGGFADVLCWRRLEEISPRVMQWWNQEYGTEGLFLGSLAIQTCSGGKLSDHVVKICEGEPREALRDWLLVGNRFEMWGWRNLKEGKRTVQLPKVMRFGWNVEKNEFEYAEDSEVEVFGWTRR